MSVLFHYDIVLIIKTVGYLGIFTVVFAESGLFLGFFLPGDSLLFASGLLASQGFFSIIPLVIIISIGAILGDNVGYWFGAKIGPAIFSRENSFFFHKKHIERTQHFYAKYGTKAVLLARLVPIVRTFTPILAGVGMMNYKLFVIYNIVGGILWGVGITCLGYFLGSAVPGSENFLLPISLIIIVLSVLPVLWEVWKSRK